MYECRQQVDIIMMDMNMMSLLQELMGMMIILVTKPIYICKWAFLFGMRTTFLVVHTWVELIKASISFHLTLIWRTIVCFVAVVSLPFRVLTALQRESLVSFPTLNCLLISNQFLVSFFELEWPRKDSRLKTTRLSPGSLISLCILAV